MSSEYRWYNSLSEHFLKRGYLLDGQTLNERVDIICNTAENILNIKGFAEQFKENFKKGWYSFSTPIWSNFGTNRGSPISCFNSCILDSMDSILATHAEVGMMSKIGGGTSAYFGNLRGRGEPITNNGESFGSVHFMKMFDSLINIVSQGNTRRGNFAAYLPIEHKDILEFLEIRREGHPIQDLFTGVTITDKWMQEMIDGNHHNRVIWAKVLESRMNTGLPYIAFIDNVNNNAPDVYKDKNLKIYSSNLCVTGDQRAVTSKGLIKVSDLCESGENLILFDGKKPVNASPMKLIEKNAPIFKITTNTGHEHRVTDYHKLKTANGMVAVKDLKIGDKVCIQKQKGLFGDYHNPELAFLLGMYHGDGTQNKNSIFLDIWENDFDLQEEIENSLDKVYAENNWNSYALNVKGKYHCVRSRKTPKFWNQTPSQNGVKKKRVGSAPLKRHGFQKHVIPEWIWTANEETQWAYIRGIYFTDGTVGEYSNNNSINLSLTSINKKYLQELQIILDNLGIKTSIYISRKSGYRLLPDGRGGKKEYHCKTSWRLVCNNKPNCVEFNNHTGFLNRKGIFLGNMQYRNNTQKFDTIVSMEFDGYEDVYCTTVESNEHVWVCNGFITSNCSEILLPSSPDESFVCDLSSMNILHYDEWKDTNAVELLVFFLDAVMTEFIEKASKIPFMERAVKFAKNHRALGIGWLGWHSYLMSKMIPFESMKAKFINVDVAKTIYHSALCASQKLANMFGEPELLKGYGRRNTTLCAIAPTKSSSFILGQVSEGIEPQRANIMIKDLAKGKFTIKNCHLENLLESKNMNTESTWNSILQNSGSVSHLSCLDDHEKAVFKTFSEISPMEIIIQASQRQKYIDQGQSLNLLIDPGVSIKEVNALYIEAWKLGIKTLYYQIGVNAAQQLSRSLTTCTSCES